MRPVRCAPSLLEPWTLSSERCLFMISFKATSAFHSPTDSPGWLFSPNALIYTVQTHTLSRARDCPKNSRTSRMSNVIYKSRLLLMMASLLCNVMSPCHLPESVSLSHRRQALDGLLTALHIQLSHPSCHQLKMVVKCYLFALDLDKAVSHVSDGCHSCAAGALRLHILTSPLCLHLKLLASSLQ